MPHCPYLLHKFVINYLFWLLFCMPRLFELATDCSIRVSRSFTRGLQPPAPQCCHTYMITIIEIYNTAARPYYCWHTTSKQSHPAPHLHIYRLKEGASLPAMFNLLFSSTNQQLFKKNFVIKVASTDDFHNKWKPSRAIDTFRGEQIWMGHKGSLVYQILSPHGAYRLEIERVWLRETNTKEGCGKSMKNALHVQQYGKRHLLGWSEVEQLNSKKIKLVALAIVELRESEGIRQAGR